VSTSTVLDRSEHWELLTQLVPGAAHLSIGCGRPATTRSTLGTSPDLRRVSPEKITYLRDLHELLIGDRRGGTDRGEISEEERNHLSEGIRRVYARCARENRQPFGA